jgi:hypothetical protein
MKLPDSFFDRLFRHARQAVALPVPEGAPQGFATRVLAQWREREPRDWTLWLLPRAIGLATACVLALLAVDGLLAPAGEEHELAGLMMSSALEGQP